jgi:hypothetical protein
MVQKVNVSFNIKLDKNVYEDSPWNTPEGFFNQLVIKHLAKDYIFLSNQINKFEPLEKEDYEGFLETLKNFKENISKSIKYELIQNIGNIEEIKISFNFQYHPNPKGKAEDILINEFFHKPIKASYFFAKEMPRLGQGVHEEKVESAIKMYNHVGDFLTEAKKSLIISVQNREL